MWCCTANCVHASVVIKLIINEDQEEEHVWSAFSPYCWYKRLDVAGVRMIDAFDYYLNYKLYSGDVPDVWSKCEPYNAKEWYLFFFFLRLLCKMEKPYAGPWNWPDFHSWWLLTKPLTNLFTIETWLHLQLNRTFCSAPTSTSPVGKLSIGQSWPHSASCPHSQILFGWLPLISHVTTASGAWFGFWFIACPSCISPSRLGAVY